MDWRDDPLVLATARLVPAIPAVQAHLREGPDAPAAAERVRLGRAAAAMLRDGWAGPFATRGVEMPPDAADRLRRLADRIDRWLDGGADPRSEGAVTETVEAALEVMQEAFIGTVVTRQVRQAEVARAATAKLDDIRRHIHLISISTSIEAARLGPEGRGFSVIAEEIRALSSAARDALANLGRPG